ncbi:MAG: DHH family phosphoesterase [Bacilli bacterium]
MILNINEFKNLIVSAQKIYIMGHSNLDLDAIGSAIGLYAALTKMHKEVYIIIEDKVNELAVEKVLTIVKGKITIIRGNGVSISPNNLLIVVDTNKTNLVQLPELLDKFTNKIVIDHHGVTEESIKASYSWINKDASSTCEMVTELVSNLGMVLSKEVNTILLSGIVLDTNNFVVKTDEKTYYSAYTLAKAGASPRDVQYLLKQDLNEYIERQKVITNVQVFKQIAITKGTENLRYRREDLAKIADTLLQFKGIEASFVIGKMTSDTVGISARSMGDFPVATIMEKLGGGGDSHDAAAKLENITIAEVENLLLDLLKEK